MVLNASCPVAFLTMAVNMSHNLTDIDPWTKAEALEAALPSSIALSSAFAIGSLFVLFLGKRLVKPTLFLGAFGCVTVGTFFALDAIVANAPDLTAMVSCLLLSTIPLILGVLAGGLALMCLQLGFFILGAGAGAGFGYTAYMAAFHVVPDPHAVDIEHERLYIACLAAGAILGALLVCRCKESILIVATASLGASGLTAATAMLLAHYDSRFLGPVVLSKPPLDPDSPYVWSQAAFYLVAFAVGVLVQCQVDKHHKRHKIKQETTALRNAQVPLITP